MRAFCRLNFATFIVAFLREVFMRNDIRERNITHELRVYQQGLSTGLSRGRGYWFDTDLRSVWYNHSLAQALKKANIYGNTLQQFTLF
jgi:hypothetical protein